MPNLMPFLTYILVTTYTPGPNNLMAMSNADKFGYRKTFRFIGGVFTGVTIVMLLCMFFNLVLFELLPKVKTYMGFFGAAYMIYLAVKVIQSGSPGEGKADERLTSYFNGVSMQFVNVKMILYGITVAATFIIPYYNSLPAFLGFAIFLALMAVISNLCWACFGLFFQRFLARYRKPFNWAMGALLIYSAVSIAGIIH